MRSVSQSLSFTRGLHLAAAFVIAVCAAGLACAADLYFDRNGTELYGDGSRLWQQSDSATNNPFWTTSPRGDISTVNYASTNGNKSVQFGFGPAPENPGGGGNVTVGNSSNPSVNNPSVGSIIFNASGSSPYTIQNQPNNAGPSITINAGGSGVPAGVGILITDSVVGTTRFIVNPASVGGNNFRVILGADQTWRNQSPDHAIEMNIAVTGNRALTTDGVGLITLGAANTFAGGLTVASGILRASHAEALSTGPVTVGAGGILDIRAEVAKNLTGSGLVTVGPGGSLSSSAFGSLALSLAGDPGSIARFTTTAAGTLGLANLTLGGNATIGMATGQSIVAAGAFTFSGLSNLIDLGGIASPGTYTLLQGGSLVNAGGIALTGSAIGNQTLALGQSVTVGRTTYDFTSTATAIQLQVTGSQLDLLWTGAVDNLWDYSTANWSDGSATSFGSGDSARIETAATIGIQTGGVQADSVTVANPSGTASLADGPLTAVTLTKSAAGTLDLANATSAGTIAVQAGTLAITGAGTLAGSSLVNDGTVVYSSSVDQTLTGTIAGSGSLSQAGTGRLTLSGGGEYAGSLAVSAGSVLEITGDTPLGPAGTYAGSMGVEGELVVSGTGSQVLSGSVGGFGKLTKAGSGVVTLAGPNGGFNGVVAVSAGRLVLGSDAALGSPDLGTSVAAGGVLDLAGRAIGVEPLSLSGNGISTSGAIANSDTTTTASWAGPVTLNSATTGIGGAGNITISGPISGNGLAKYGEGTVTLSGTNSFTGTLDILAGTVRVANQAALPNVNLAWNNGASSATLDMVGPGTYQMAGISRFGSILRVMTTGTGVATLQVAGDSVLSGSADKSLEVEADTRVVLNGDITAGAATRNRDLRFYLAGEAEVNGIMIGTGDNQFGLIKGAFSGDHNGTLFLNNSNFYNGQTLVSAGTLKVGNALALGDTTTGTRLTIQTQNVDTPEGPVTQPIPGLVPGTLDLNGFTIFGESLRFEGTYARPLLLNSSSSTAAGWSGPTEVIAQAGVGGAGDIDVSGAISGTSGMLAKVGAGMVTLSAANTFTGSIDVEQGTLALAAGGSLENASAVRVAAGATFDVSTKAGGYSTPAGQTIAGSGHLEGSLTLSSGATLSPGASSGTLAVTQGVTLSGGGNYNWQILDATGTAGSTTGWDLLSVGGALSISATSADPFRLNLWSLSSAGPDVNGNALNFSPTQGYTWKIASAAGGITGFASDAFTINTTATNGTGGFTNGLSGGSFSLAVTGNDLNLVFAPGAGPTDIVIEVPSGSQTQGQAGYASIAAANSVTKTGAGTVVFDAANTYSGPTAVSAGTLEVANADALAATTVTVDTGATLAVASGTTIKAPAVIVDGGTLSAATVAVNSATGITSLAINAGTVSGAPVVSVGSGGQLSLVQDARVLVGVGGLSVDQGTGGGRLDVGAGQVTVAAGGISAADLRADIIAGRNGGAWNGAAGIMSSTAAGAPAGTRAVGYVVAGDGSARVSFAAPGDSDLSGQVNVFDLLAIDSAGRFGTGQPAVWNQGDFNYDGVANIFDLLAIDSSGVYGTGNYLPAAPSTLSLSGSVAAVPEPGLGVAAIAAVFITAGVTLRRHQKC